MSLTLRRNIVLEFKKENLWIKKNGVSNDTHQYIDEQQ